jgi:hypothetical protein
VDGPQEARKAVPSFLSKTICEQDMKNTILPIILPFVLSVAPLAAQQGQPSPRQANDHGHGVVLHRV